MRFSRLACSSFLLLTICACLFLNPTLSWMIVPTPTRQNHAVRATRVTLRLGPRREGRGKKTRASPRRKDEDSDTIAWGINTTLDNENAQEVIINDNNYDEIASWTNDVSGFSINTGGILRNASTGMLLADIQTLSSNVSYFYLKNELGLSEEDMWKITCDAPSVLGLTADNIRRKLGVLRNLMGLSDEELRTIIRRQPSVLQLSADKNISPSILNLLRLLDLGRDELKTLIVSNPGILTFKMTNVRSKIRFFTDALGFSTEECRKLFLKEPMLLRVGLHTGLIPRASFLMEDVQVSRDDLRRIVMRHPRILMYSLEDNLVPKLVFYCLMTVRLETKQVVKLLQTYPEFMAYNLDRTILPITRYFLQDLDFSLPEFQKILLGYPRLVSNSLTKIKYVVGYLRFEMGLCAEQVRRVLYQAPTMLGFATDTTVRYKVAFLREELKVDDEDWKRLVTGIPNVLLLSIDGNVKPKLVYLREAFDNDTDSLREAVLRLPTLLGYSLEKRIVPRMQAILEAGLDPSNISTGIAMKEERFQQWLQGRIKKLAKTPMVLEVDVDVDESSQGSSDSEGRILHWTRERRRKR